MGDEFDFKRNGNFEPIMVFKGPYRFLSNFWPCEVVYEGVTYPSTEHAFQAAKTLDLTKRAAICIAESPGVAKRLGRAVTLRPDWDTLRLGVMEDLLRQKFVKPSLTKLLLATEDVVLIEGNDWHDQFWGMCFCPKHEGRGENHLGRLLMQVRSDIRDAL
jgi:ribA/ribD-fused uncharacterized protein